jgi:hypothetical protein
MDPVEINSKDICSYIYNLHYTKKQHYKRQKLAIPVLLLLKKRNFGDTKKTLKLTSTFVLKLARTVKRVSGRATLFDRRHIIMKKAEWLERLTANAKVATVLGSIPACPDTGESEMRQMKQC